MKERWRTRLQTEAKNRCFFPFGLGTSGFSEIEGRERETLDERGKVKETTGGKVTKNSGVKNKGAVKVEEDGGIFRNERASLMKRTGRNSFALIET